MLEDAKRDGCHLNVTGGYVDKETQQTQYEQEVQRLMDSGGYTRVRAQEDAKTTVQPGNYSELQTGMAVQFASAESSDGLRKIPFVTVLFSAIRPVKPQLQVILPLPPSFAMWVRNMPQK